MVIEGHAGTGKSTTLTGIARAHHACDREILITSTAALAAERLATELAERGVTCQAYSTASLDAAIKSGRVELSDRTTVIHNEAALASTREQLHLLHAIDDAGARLIAVGDVRQNQPVGAGGLWTRLTHTAHEADAWVELTVNQRAHDPDDRRDQARFRDGQVELAIRGYAARDRIRHHGDQQHAEDRALEAAHADLTAGKSTIVIAQTSNEHLDVLNARAQAIRRQAGMLGDERLEIPRRQYGLHAGDDIQIRHTITHPDHGQIRNGTAARVTSVDPDSHELDLRLADGSEVSLDERQIADADLRLVYVQHPFPAQGHTTDTAHLIVAQNATREGTYVALTRAREQTHIYAAEPVDLAADRDHLQDLAERVSRTEPDLPSIQTPLAHEAQVLHAANVARTREPPAELRPDVDMAPLAPDHTTSAPLRHEPDLTHTALSANDEHTLELEPDIESRTAASTLTGLPQRRCEHGRDSPPTTSARRIALSRSIATTPTAGSRDPASSDAASARPLSPEIQYAR